VRTSCAPSAVPGASSVRWHARSALWIWLSRWPENRINLEAFSWQSYASTVDDKNPVKYSADSTSKRIVHCRHRNVGIVVPKPVQFSRIQSCISEGTVVITAC